jgi:hypothetical protein
MPPASRPAQNTAFRQLHPAPSRAKRGLAENFGAYILNTLNDRFYRIIL